MSSARYQQSAAPSGDLIAVIPHIAAEYRPDAPLDGRARVDTGLT